MRARKALHTVSSGNSTVIAVAATGIGIALRVIGAVRPLDQPSWREGDLVSIARGFASVDANILHPRVSWRGLTNGLVEGELPLVSWITAMVWKGTGEHLQLMRLVPAIAGLLSLLVFWKITSKYLRGARSMIAVSLFALNPLAVFLTGSVQSDGLMLLGTLVAIWSVLTWTEDKLWSKRWRRKDLLWPIMTVAGVSLAGLMKVIALHICIPIAAIVLLRHGLKSLFRLRVLLVGALSTVGPLAWTVYAHTLYNQTGLSLGVSNEHHIAGLEMLRNLELIKGIASHEIRYVWALGIFPAAFALWIGRRQFVVRVVAIWLAAVGVMLVVAGRTTGDAWAFYYHVAAVAPASMLAGYGIGEGFKKTEFRRAAQPTGPSSLSQRLIRKFGPGLATLLGILVLLPGLRSSVGFVRPRAASRLFGCAKAFSGKLPAGLVLTSGGIRLDDGGNQVAYDASYMFEWLRRNGWTIAVEDQSIKNVLAFKSKGAVAFIAEKEQTDQAKGFEADLRSTFPVLVECEGTATLYNLNG
jgi:Dolichyl-phosphate-mannose-protein mannosyltransferase